MIPLSNGRSPRIDQFYATLRTYKSHQFQEDYNTKTEQDKSIEHIRSLGKQIFEEKTTSRKKNIVRQSINNLNKSQQSIVKPPNLYDKYKEHTCKQISRQVNRAKQIIIKQEINKTPNKIANKKYDQIQAKIMKGSSVVNGLNYSKKSEIEAQKLRKQKVQAQQAQREMRQKQIIFDKSYKAIKPRNQFYPSGVLKRGEEMKARKSNHIEQIRNQSISKQMQGVTFIPEKFSKDIGNVQQNWEKRMSLACYKKTSNERSLIKQIVEEHSFHPQLNEYMARESKVQKMWKDNRLESVRKTSTKSSANLSHQGFTNEVGKYKSQQATANSTMQINLKAINQISFIFE